MNIIDLFSQQLYKEELQKFDKKKYVLSVQAPVLGKPDTAFKIEDYKEMCSPDLYHDLNEIYSRVNEISIFWSAKKGVNDKKILANQWITQEVFEERGFGIGSIEECLGGVLNIVSLKEMMTDRLFTDLYNEAGVEYLTLDRHWTRVACLKKVNGVAQNNVYFFHSEDHETVYDMKIGVLEYLELAYNAKCFYNWQYAFLSQKKGHFANDHLRIMLPKLLPHLTLDLSGFGIKKSAQKTGALTKKEYYSEPKGITTYTKFPKAEAKLTRYLMTLDKDVECRGSDRGYHATFNALLSPIDFSQFSELYLKFAAEEDAYFPISLNHVPDNCDLSSLEQAPTIQSIHLTYARHGATDFSSLANKNMPHIEKMWLQNFNNIQDTDFLKSFQNLSELKLLSFKNSRLSEDWTSCKNLRSLTIRGVQNQDQALTKIILPKATKSLTIWMDSMETIPHIEGEGLEYLELKSRNISKIEKLDQLKSLQLLKIENGGITKVEGLDNLPSLKILSLKSNKINDFTNLAKLPAGTKVWLSKKEFETEDRKTNMKRRLKLKHLDVKLS